MQGCEQKRQTHLELPWPEAPNLQEKWQEGLAGFPQPPEDAEANTYLGLLLPEREPLLLVQQPCHDQEAELASKLPAGEGARETEGMHSAGLVGVKVCGWAGKCRTHIERGAEPLCLGNFSFLLWFPAFMIYFRSHKKHARWESLKISKKKIINEKKGGDFRG